MIQKYFSEGMFNIKRFLFFFFFLGHRDRNLYISLLNFEDFIYPRFQDHLLRDRIREHKNKSRLKCKFSP